MCNYPLLPWIEQRCRVSGALTSLMSSFTKGRVALFPGTQNNWCVYTINGGEKSTFSGEIWTLQHYHLLLPLNRAEHFTKSYDGFQIVPFVIYVAFAMQCYKPLYLWILHVFGSTMSFVLSTQDVLLHCYVLICYLMYCMCLYFDIKYRGLQYNLHLLQFGNCFADNIRHIPVIIMLVFMFFPA